MGLLRRVLKPQAARILDLERLLRSAGAMSKSGVAVTTETALRVAAVYACVRVLAEDVAKLPLILYRRTPNGGKERATDHPLYEVLHTKPNSWQTSFEWREMLQGHLGLRGNAYALIVRTGDRVKELIPIHPDRVTPKQERDFSVRYEVAGASRAYTDREILHLRGLASDGVMGLSPIALARESIGLSVAAEQHGARLFVNGVRPGGVAIHPQTLSEEAAKRLKASIEEAISGENIHRVLLLEEGMTWTQVGMTNEDAQFLETRKFQVAEIARWYRMPLHKIQDLDRATFSNIEHQAIEYVQDTLMPWLVRWEQRISASLLSPRERETYFVEFLVDGLLRGDIKSRYEAYGIGVEKGWMSPNEVRIKENMNPVPGLDEYRRPMNTEPVARTA